MLMRSLALVPHVSRCVSSMSFGRLVSTPSSSTISACSASGTEVERFATAYFMGPLVPADRIALEALVRNAVARFEGEEDEGRQEEFRQLLKSFMRFYSFVAQVVRLADTSLEKLYAYASWLARLLPNREEPPDIEMTEDMLRLQAFRVEQKEEGSASVIFVTTQNGTISTINHDRGHSPRSRDALDIASRSCLIGDTYRTLVETHRASCAVTSAPTLGGL
jgi:hypothetical protein